MLLKKAIINILDNYLPVKSLDNKQKQELKISVENDLKNILTKIIPDDNYIIKGRTGVGRWADVPWLGIHNKTINSNAKTGIYVTILFFVDGSGFSFSIQQGTEDFNIKEIKDRVTETRKFVYTSSLEYTKTSLNIRGKSSNLSSSSRPAKYELANIIGVQYERNNIPENLEKKLLDLIDIYHQLSQRLSFENSNDSIHYEVFNSNLEKKCFSEPKVRLKERYIIPGALHPPRDTKTGNISLANANYTCEIDCNHNTFITQYGLNYMEKHHLIPMKFYFDFELSIDHSANIFCLCATCHRQIHYGKSIDKEKLIRILFNKRAEDYKKFYGIKDLYKIYQYYTL